jgi:TRAP-type C4-dicarboxylate transport system substrate-binding protein
MSMIRWLLVAVLSSGLMASFVASATTFKIATISIDGSGWMKAMRAAAADVEVATQGRVKFKFYPGGVMGDDTTVLRRMRLGQLHGAALTAGSLTSAYTDVQLYNLPMVFRDLDEVDYVRERLDPQLMRGLSANGYEALGFAEVGFAYPMSSVQATSVADVRGLKVWVPAGDPGTQRTAEAFGIAPIPLTMADVLAGLQTGLINAVTIPPIGAVALQWHTQLDYVLDLPLLYVFGTMGLSNSSFSKLSAADQETVRRLVGAALAGIDAQSRADHESALAALQQQGLVLMHPGADEFSEWQSSADAGTARMLETGVVTQTGYDTLNTYLLEYRNGAEVSVQ